MSMMMMMMILVSLMSVCLCVCVCSNNSATQAAVVHSQLQPEFRHRSQSDGTRVSFHWFFCRVYCVPLYGCAAIPAKISFFKDTVICSIFSELELQYMHAVVFLPFQMIMSLLLLNI